MPLSWNEIRDRAIAFSREWNDTTNEDAEAKSFIDALFNVFGVSRRRVASFEHRVKKIDGKDGFIDLLWPGKLLIEQKSLGKNLDRAHRQARDYFPGLKDRELPQYILVCDFQNFRLYDLESGKIEDFKLSEFPKKIQLFGFVAGYQSHSFEDQDPVNIDAAELMGKLHDELKANGYEGHDLEVLLVRLLFCLFADDTGIFLPKGLFHRYIIERTSEDGSDLAGKLTELFQVLNTSEDKRFKNLDDQLNAFPYVNGKLFEERITTASFSSSMRRELIKACDFEWSAISPAVFGALFQSILDDKARRNLGAHYTSERNILKLIKPLFLDELRLEFDAIRRNSSKLKIFHDKLRSLTFFDPACGCGNFLIISYRELRKLELDVVRALYDQDQLEMYDVRKHLRVDVDQFYGIEVEEFPAQIAQVALWLVDHQMNNEASLVFGRPVLRIPLTTSAKIVQDNALTLDWNTVIPSDGLSYVLGNPPFIGAKMMDDAQRRDAASVFTGIMSAGLLDYVAAWYVKAARYIKGTLVRCAFVSTNSITQGEQVGVLWTELHRLGMHIHFAHKTFVWSNEASGVAAVHCVIIGFGAQESKRPVLFEYSHGRGEPLARAVSRINPYLVDAPPVVLFRRDQPLSPVPPIGIGNKPIDGGLYLFDDAAKKAFIEVEPQSEMWFRKWVGAEEMLNNISRWCLWIGECPPEKLRRMPEVLKRIEAVRQYRLSSKSAPTRKLAESPTRFHVENIPESAYLVIPEVSSERRLYMPLDFLEPTVLASNKLRVLPNATLYHFGVLSSMMHMSWMRYTSVRLKSDYQYSVTITYNNFPWPSIVTSQQTRKIEEAAKRVLEIREKYPNASLADLYDPRAMPSELLKAHQNLDSEVDNAYGRRSFKSEADRVAFLFGLYNDLTAPLLLGSSKKTRKNTRKTVNTDHS